MKDWFLDRIEVINTETGEHTVFACNKWLSKKKEDGEIARDLYPLMDERDAFRRKEQNSRSPRRTDSSHDDYGRGGKHRGMAYDDEIALDRNAGRRDRFRNEY